MCLRTAHHESAAPKLSNTDNVKENNIMNKANFNVVGNNENQELLKGIAFVKSRRAPLNVAQMVMEMNAKTIPNGVMIDTVYADTSSEGDYDRKAGRFLCGECRWYDEFCFYKSLRYATQSGSSQSSN